MVVAFAAVVKYTYERSTASFAKALSMTSFYDEDLAYIHHVGFRDVLTRAIPSLLGILRRLSVTSGLVVDLGCGDGRLLPALTDAGYQALGVDVSPAFIALAREAAPEAELRRASAHDIELPVCAAVTAIGEVLSYLPPHGDDGPPLAETLRRIYRALRPGGVLFFDVIVEGGKAVDATRSWRAGADWAVLSEVDEDPARRLLTRRIIAFRKLGDVYRRSDEIHRQRIYRRAEVEADLRTIGFRIERAAAGYGDGDLPPGRCAFVCRKPILHAMSG
jgi:SAM-dependent methyltransferase